MWALVAWNFPLSKFCQLAILWIIIVILFTFCAVGVVLKEICVEMHKKEFPQGQVSKVQDRGAGLLRNAQDYSAWLNPFTGLSHNLEIRTAACHFSYFTVSHFSRFYWWPKGTRRQQTFKLYKYFVQTWRIHLFWLLMYSTMIMICSDMPL